MSKLNYEIKIEFDDSRDLLISAISNDAEIGHLDAWLVIDEIQINNVLVKEEYRRNKIASAMLEKLFDFAHENACNKITLEVREGNEPARKLYEKYDFRQVGMRENYYQDNNENAILMDADID